jgi:DNA-binding transcriptional MocR family regulator
MVLPPQLVATVTMAKAMTDVGTSVMDQLAFTHLLTSGVYDRHLRQMRRRYVVRRNTLLQALARLLPEVTVLGTAAGLHLTARFPDGFAIHELVRRAAAAGVRVEPTAACYADRAAAPPGLVLGYANLTESQIVTGVQKLASLADERLREEHVTDERLREEHVTDERSREASAPAATATTATATATTTTATAAAAPSTIATGVAAIAAGATA